MLNKPERISFDKFGEKVILRVAFHDGHGVVETIVVDLSKLVIATKDTNLVKLIERLVETKLRE